jgi:hypothetical protein
MTSSGNLAYYDINTFNTKNNLKIVALKISILIRSDNVIKSSHIDPSKQFDLFGIPVTGLSGLLTNTSSTNQIPRQLYIATVALRNGLGENR